MIAWVNGFIGLGATVWVGSSFLGLPVGETLGLALVAWLAGCIAVIGTLEAQALPWVRSRVLSRPTRTWILFLSLYFGTLLALAPRLRDPGALAALILPLILVSGFSILVFGPYQDWRVAGRQRRERALVSRQGG